MKTDDAARVPDRRRVAFFVSHPIQYYAPWFRHLTQWLEVEVFYALRQDAGGQARAGFGVGFEWDTPLLEGYPHRFLVNVARHPGLETFGGCDTPEVGAILERSRFDAAVVVGWNRKSSLQAIAAAWRRGVPILLRGDSQRADTRTWLKRAVKFVPYRLLLARVAAGHLVVGERNREYLRHHGVPDAKLFFVPHCVDTRAFADGAAAAERDGRTVAIRAALGIPPEAFVCGFVGKLIAKKRPADLVSALALLSQGENVHGLFVGDGPLRAEVAAHSARAPGRVHCVGFRNQSELPAYYRAMDCLVLPSDARETWGLVVNEAAACGVPAIVTDAVGCGPDLIEEGRTGFLYPCGRADRLAARIEALSRVVRASPDGIRTALERKTRAYSLEAATEALLRALAVVGRG